MTIAVEDRRQPCVGISVWSSLLACLGSLLLGYSTGVTSGVLLYIRSDYQTVESLALSEGERAIFASVLMGAGGVGAVLFGIFADMFGRRAALGSIAALFLAGSIILAAAPSYAVLILGRLITGMGCGGGLMVCPCYISEMSAPDQRGALVNFNEMFISLGILLAFGANAVATALPDSAKKDCWRFMFAGGALPALALLLAVMCFLPETPRFLVKRGRSQDLRASRALLERIYFERGNIAQPRQEADKTMAAIKESLAVKTEWSEFFRRPLSGVAFVGFMMALLQQFVGVDTIIMFTPDILEAAGYAKNGEDVDDRNDSYLFVVLGVGFVKFFVEVVVIFTVDRCGRRWLLLSGGGLLVLCNAAIGTMLYIADKDIDSFHDDGGHWGVVALLWVYTGAFAFSWGPICWIIVSEIFPTDVRGTLMGISVFLNRMASFAVTGTFLSLSDMLGGKGYTFFVYTGISAAAWLFALVAVPETRGVSLEQIKHLFGDRGKGHSLK